VAGGAVGLLADETKFPSSEIGRSAQLIAAMDPHLMLYVFLPPLIFESAFSMNFHMFSKTFWKCLILAGPGLIFCVGLLGAGLKLWLYKDETWETCFLLGAILSATDPVAVVALLKDLGASKKLGTLIEGESLLNDGTAMVVFLVLYDKVTISLTKHL
jgi:NhaP-type Na+/H+ or K+/H+ antiporter